MLFHHRPMKKQFRMDAELTHQMAVAMPETARIHQLDTIHLLWVVLSHLVPYPVRNLLLLAPVEQTLFQACFERDTIMRRREMSRTKSRIHSEPTYMILAPSINANITPPNTADVNIACGPARAARIPPVAAPLIIAFHGSSFCRIAVNVQSQQANNPPQTAN
mmetsp:Transcript_17859/g.42138  ORF Transcript_17859/g.42138 Transcript_17859/m.42138 type:complete len:163 (+) Transcript_17859:212-700(+)